MLSKADKNYIHHLAQELGEFSSGVYIFNSNELFRFVEAIYVSSIVSYSNVEHMTYRGNSVHYIYQKMKAYQSSIDELHNMIPGTGNLIDRVRMLISETGDAPAKS